MHKHLCDGFLNFILTYHYSSAFWVNSEELSRNDAPATALPKCFLVDLLEHVL